MDAFLVVFGWIYKIVKYTPFLAIHLNSTSYLYLWMNTLEEITGKHTELVSFYVKSSWSTAQATSYIDGELAKSLNIKSKLTRDNVQRALYKIKNNIQTGVVFFSGVVNDELFFKVIQPPKSVNFTLYRCSNRFHTDELSRFEPKKELRTACFGQLFSRFWPDFREFLRFFDGNRLWSARKAPQGGFECSKVWKIKRGFP